MPSTPRPPRVAIVNDFEMVVTGLAAMLAPYDDRIRVVELDSRLPTVADVDLVLFDAFGSVPGDGLDISDLVRPDGPKVVVFTWASDPKSVARAQELGAAAHVSKTLSPKALVQALEDIHAGLTPEPQPQLDLSSDGWPGQEHGLSPREAEVLALIARGMSNQEIAAAIYLSVNSVKTYIRTAYRKIGVQRRGQAVVWALRHGFEPSSGRTFPPQ
jgi:NarL family two-component system response regulator LiaR